MFDACHRPRRLNYIEDVIGMLMNGKEDLSLLNSGDMELKETAKELQQENPEVDIRSAL